MKMFITFLLLLSISFPSFSSLSVISSLTSSSDLAGGLRFAPSDIEVIDIGVTYDSTVDNPKAGFWIDYYYDHFGVLISAPADAENTYSFMFAAEGSISDSVGIGIGFKILEMKKSDTPKYFSGWDAYLIIPI